MRAQMERSVSANCVHQNLETDIVYKLSNSYPRQVRSNARCSCNSFPQCGSTLDCRPSRGIRHQRRMRRLSQQLSTLESAKTLLVGRTLRITGRRENALHFKAANHRRSVCIRWFCRFSALGLGLPNANTEQQCKAAERKSH